MPSTASPSAAPTTTPTITPTTTPGFKFTCKNYHCGQDDLKRAIELWVDDQATAEIKYGSIETWWEAVPAPPPGGAARPFEFCESSKAARGDAVYVVGGFLCDFNRVTDRVQMLNASSGAWTTVARLPASAAKTHHGAALSEDGSWLYLASGQLGPGCTLGTAESWALRFVGRKQKKAVWVRLPDLPEVRYSTLHCKLKL